MSRTQGCVIAGFKAIKLQIQLFSKLKLRLLIITIFFFF